MHLAAAINERLLELEAGNAVTEESADVGAPFVDGNLPSLPAQGHGGGKPRRTGADDCGGLAVLLFRRAWHDPSACKRRLDDALLGLPHHHGLFIKAVDAARLAERRADAGGEFGEIGMGREEFVGKLEIALRHGTVLVGHEVAERAAVGVAERLAAVHAARRLFLQGGVWKEGFDLLPVAFALFRGPVYVLDSFHV